MTTQRFSVSEGKSFLDSVANGFPNFGLMSDPIPSGMQWVPVMYPAIY